MRIPLRPGELVRVDRTYWLDKLDVTDDHLRHMIGIILGVVPPGFRSIMIEQYAILWTGPHAPREITLEVDHRLRRVST